MPNKYQVLFYAYGNNASRGEKPFLKTHSMDFSDDHTIYTGGAGEYLGMDSPDGNCYWGLNIRDVWRSEFYDAKGVCDSSQGTVIDLRHYQMKRSNEPLAITRGTPICDPTS